MKLASSLLTTLLLTPAAFAQTTWYVDDDATPPGLGTQTDPYASIQYALDQPTTLDGDTVQVAYGEYDEALDFQGKAVTVVGIPNGVTGAFPRVRPPAGSAVTFTSGEGPGSELRRMDLRFGAGTPVGGELRGGTVFIRAASPTLTQVNVRNGVADRGGAVAIMDGASPTFVQVDVWRSEAHEGAGVWIEGSSLTWTGGSMRRGLASVSPAISGPTRGTGLAAFASQVQLEDVELVNNGSVQPPDEGGGLWADGASSVQVLRGYFERNFATFGGGTFGPVHVEDCFLTFNYGFTEGGGLLGGSARGTRFENNRSILGAGASQAQLDSCTLEQNYQISTNFGGAAYASHLVDCLVRNNDASAGGGIYGGSALRTRFEGNRAAGFGSNLGGAAMCADLVRCVFFDNGSEQGSAVWLGTPPAGFPPADPGSALHCTFARNPRPVAAGTDTGAAIYLGAGAGPVDMCAFVNNVNGDVNAPLSGDVRFSCLQAPFPGPGNFVADPLLVSSQGADAHLLAGSPCIDAGDPFAAPDPDGSVPDVGAFIYDPSYAPEPFEYCGDFLPTSCGTGTVTAQGQLQEGGLGGLTLTVGGFDGPAYGLALFGLEPDSVPVPATGVLCIDTPRRSTTIFSTSGAPAPCAGQLAITLDGSEVQGLGGERIFVQGALFVSGRWELTSAFETVVLP